MESFVLPRGTVYLDAAATSLMPRFVLDVQREYYETACANPHTEAHAQGRSSTQVVEDARRAIAGLFGVDQSLYAICFVGSGSTAAINRAARVMSSVSPGVRDTVIVTEMDHHSNILPWRRSARVLHAPILRDGSLDMDVLERMIAEEGPRLRAVALSAASNVTGARVDVARVCSWAKSVGAWCFVDAAQAAPHEPLSVAELGIDGMAISGHKLYAPGSPGVLILRRDLFTERPHGDVGGGAVDRVYLRGETWQSRIEDREEAGTPNVPGILALGAVCIVLQRVGMRTMLEHDVIMGQRLYDGLRSIPGVRVYGGREPGGRARLATVSFNIVGLPYRVSSRALDERGFAVRDACFCAHPYVRRLLNEDEVPRNGIDGMVRASCGPWNTEADIDRFVQAVRELAANPSAVRVVANPPPCFSLEEAVDESTRRQIVAPSGAVVSASASYLPAVAVIGAVAAAWATYEAVRMPSARGRAR